MDLTEGLIEDDGERAYLDELRRAVDAPGVEVLRAVCARCGNRRRVARVYRRGSTLLWVADGHAPEAQAVVPSLKRDSTTRVPDPVKLSRVLLNVPVDERVFGHDRAEAHCRRHGWIAVDEDEVAKLISSARGARVPTIEV
jgi:hypothetical protein